MEQFSAQPLKHLRKIRRPNAGRQNKNSGNSCGALVLKIIVVLIHVLLALRHFMNH
jgi:hypothetical protein